MQEPISYLFNLSHVPERYERACHILDYLVETKVQPGSQGHIFPNQQSLITLQADSQQNPSLPVSSLYVGLS